MADLPEVNEWPEGIYQLETSDPVLGGPEGIDNLQGKQLANRTKWLKDQISKIVDGVTSIGSALKLATPRALNFKGAATGSGSFDGSADVEIALTLANSGVTAGAWPRVTVNSKGLVTGGSALSPNDLPEGLTAPQFDNDKSLATTEFVQRALGNFSGQTTISTSAATLTPAMAGRRISGLLPGAWTLPPLNSSPIGSKFYIQNSSPGDIVVSRQGADVIVALSKTGNSINIPAGSFGVLVCGEINWVFEEGVSALKYSAEFASSISGSGWAKNANGLIEQWGVGVTDANGYVYVTFPIPFPNGVRNVTPTHFGSSSLMHAVMDANFTLTGCRLRVQNTGGAASGWQVFWRALGN
ncbi:gp53-like domain-containing protein [Pseudomonas sp. P42]|uniref:gp53-like domain-containing protein n=1 Tax=Pseudomonas sp. P42 TaxID=1080160 RepID=UPI001B329298|nr:hypothetical protein [Pseudomonas sp. P42]MBP5951294.1 hypothetical protein [Pseudomonas sp. P42]